MLTTQMEVLTMDQLMAKKICLTQILEICFYRKKNKNFLKIFDKSSIFQKIASDVIFLKIIIIIFRDSLKKHNFNGLFVD